MTAARTEDRGTALGAQQVASDPGVSSWVEANAGAGKTWVLVDRVTRLMLEGAPPARILCLTFTRAAAAEMANRLFQRLGAWAVMPEAGLGDELMRLTGRPAAVDTVRAARRLFARALDAPGGLKIQTIHAFCESLIGRFPLEAGIAPHFAVMDERTAADLLAEARDRVLRQATDGAHPELAAALDRIVALVSDADFAELVADLANRRGRLRRTARAHDDFGGLVRATRRTLGLAEGESAEAIVAAACGAPAFDGEGLGRACAALDQGSDKDRERAAVIRAWLSGRETRERGLMGAYGRVFLRGDGGPRAESGLITKAARAADETAREVLLAEQARVHAVFERLRAAAVAAATADLLRLGAALLGAFEAHKRAHARLDYDDLILTARDLLRADGGASWVLYKLDGGIDHILIDEAQDTNPDQWEVVKALSEEFFAGAGAREEAIGPRTVFAVGDEKQSIYGFQGVDPEAFARTREHFAKRVAAGGGLWRPVSLVQSHRSAPPVLAAVDLVFAREAARDGVASAPVRHFAAREGHAGLVELWPTVTPREPLAAEPWDAAVDQLAADSPPARLARRIAAEIRRWIDDGEVLESRGRPIRPGDIMILVRRRGPFFEEMVRCLKERGVPVAGTDRMDLAEQLAVMDLVALGEFLLLPEDDLTLAVVLKGPLFGLEEGALFDLAFGREESLWAALGRRRDERPDFAAAHGELAALLAKADTTPPFAFFADLLGPGRGRERLLARLGGDAGDPIDEFLSLALEYGRGHAPSLQGFLHWLKAGRIEIKRDLEQGRDEVRVMTVHGAKGLQAEVVFLPDTCAVPGRGRGPRLLWAGGDGAPVMLWPVRRDNDEAVCTAAREAARRRSLEEYRRLLYVALTRARDRLYVCGFETASGRDQGCWYDLVADAIREAAEEVRLASGGTGWRLSSRQEAKLQEAGGAEEEAAAGAPPAWALAPPPPEASPPRPLAPSRPAEEEPAAMSPLGAAGGAEGEAGRLRGRLTHHLLQVVADLAPGERAAACDRFLSRPVHGLDAAAQREIRQEALAILEEPAFAALFGPGSRAEVPLAGLLGETVVFGQVDRLAVTEAEVQVIDYKTDRPAPAAPEEVPAAYLRQMAAYRALVAAVYPGREVRCALLWTCGPRLMALDGGLLDRYAP